VSNTEEKLRQNRPLRVKLGGDRTVPWVCGNSPLGTVDSILPERT